MKSHPELKIEEIKPEVLSPKELKFTAKLKKRVGKDLYDLYQASKSLLFLIPNMIKQANTEDLRQSLEAQFEAVQVQVYKLERLFIRMNEKPKLILTRTPTWMAGQQHSQKF